MSFFQSFEIQVMPLNTISGGVVLWCDGVKLDERMRDIVFYPGHDDDGEGAVRLKYCGYMLPCCASHVGRKRVPRKIRNICSLNKVPRYLCTLAALLRARYTSHISNSILVTIKYCKNGGICSAYSSL